MRSRNYTPSVTMAPYIARHYIFSVDAPDSFELTEHLLSETAFIRVLLLGDWAAELVPGEWSVAGPMVFFGPNSRPLRVRVRGGFRVVGIAICPAAWSAFFDDPADLYADRMLPLGELWGERSDALYRAIAAVERDDAEGDAAIVAAIEAHVSALIAARGNIAAKVPMQHFELIARNDSTALIRDVADRLGMTERQLERNCRACFGMSPKALLRRSRFLDMATALRGISHPDEQELAALRYYDQSHLIREFRHFITMTPGQFVQTATPLLTAGLELRNLRKAENAERQTKARQ